MPSLSSASTTSHSPSPNAALVPTSLTSPPITKLGCQPAPRRISASIDDVVVLPCEPGDRDRAPGRRERGQRGRRGAAPGSRARRAATSSTFVARDRGRVHDRVGVGGTCSARLPTCTSTPAAASRSSTADVLEVGAADRVAHAREQRARSRSCPRRRRRRCGPARRVEVERGHRDRRAPASARHGRAPRRGRRAARRRRAGRAPRAAVAHRVEPLRRRRAAPETTASSRGRVALGVGHDDRRARPLERRARCGSDGRSARPGSGTSTAGTPAAVSSATCPRRPGTPRASARASSAVHVLLVRRRARRRARRRRGAARRARPRTRRVARPAHVVDREVGRGRASGRSSRARRG